MSPLTLEKGLRYLTPVFCLIAEKMDSFECITTKLDVREFSAEDVPVEIRSNMLE